MHRAIGKKNNDLHVLVALTKMKFSLGGI